MGVIVMKLLEKINAFASNMLTEFSAVENDSEFILALQEHDLYYDLDRASRYLEHIKEYTAAYIYAYERETSNA